MATQAYYRKWRSQTFAELVGQEHVSRTLRNAVRTDRLAHAYVFSGPRGVGKTSTARLLAKAVNCENATDGEPCNQCQSCRAIAEGRAIDVVEIDAASHTGIDQIRDLSAKVGFMPSESRYKFYVLDEAHRLSGAAADAFLKTLEEPPAHTVFVLVTTEPHKLAATVLSRCQRLEFRRIPVAAAVGRLRQICESEGIVAEPAALELIARSATGSLRDAEGLLDQVVSYTGASLGVAEVRAVVGLGGAEAAHELLEHLASADLAAGLRLVSRLVEAGADPRQLTREVVDYLRGLLLLKAGESLGDLLDVTGDTLARMVALARRLTAAQVLQSIRIFAQGEPSPRGVSLEQLPLEMAFVEAVLALGGTAPAAQPAAPARSAGEPVRAAGQPRSAEARRRDASASRAVPAVEGAAGHRATADTPRPPDEVAHTSGDAGSPPAPEPATSGPPEPAPSERRAPARATDEAGAAALTFENLVARWPDVVEHLGAGTRTRNVQALLRDARPLEIEGADVAIVACRYSFHRDRLNDDRTRGIVETALAQTLGRRCRVRFVVAGGEGAWEVTAPQPDPFQAMMGDPVIKGAMGMGWRVRRIVKQEEVVYDAEPQDDPAASGQAGQDAGRPG